MAAVSMSPAEAAGTIRDTDTVAVPLGPGVPGQFMHALAARERYDDLLVFGALLPDLYEVFLRPGVRLQSGFFGPAERFLIAANATVDFVPADFRRFAPALEAIAPRVMTTSAAPTGCRRLDESVIACRGRLSPSCIEPPRTPTGCVW